MRAFHISTKKLLIAGMLAGPLFTVSWLINGAIREGYDPLRHPVSALAIGNHGWIQAVTFLLVGPLLLGFSLAVSRILKSQGFSVSSARLLALCAVGLIGAGLFVCDPLSGYPAGMHTSRSERSVSGMLHDAFSAFLFIGYPFAAFKFSKIFVQKKERAWANYTKFSALAFICLFIVTSMGFGQVTGFVEYGGLFQRLTLTVFWVWVTLISIHFFNETEKNGIKSSMKTTG